MNFKRVETKLFTKLQPSQAAVNASCSIINLGKIDQKNTSLSAISKRPNNNHEAGTKSAFRDCSSID